jgi:hypothetical protein
MFDWHGTFSDGEGEEGEGINTSVSVIFWLTSYDVMDRNHPKGTYTKSDTYTKSEAVWLVWHFLGP